MAHSTLSRAETQRIIRAAVGELDRAMGEMRIPGHPRPYYISYLIRDEDTWRIQSKYGARVLDTRDRKRNAWVDVRVGSYRNDHVREGGLLDNDKDAESYAYVELPFAGHLDALRHGLWRLTDARYREAVESLLDKQSHELTYRDTNRHLLAFEKREAVVDRAWSDFPSVDREAWGEFADRTSSMVRRFPEIRDSHVEFEAHHACRMQIDSCGARIVQCLPIWSLECYMWLLSPRGDGIPWTVRHMVTDPSELPDEATFRKQIRDAVEILRGLSVAPTLRSFCGPALLEPVPAGLLVHEALGHRLEGTRLLSPGEGQTFRDAVGKKILPGFLSILDDPRRATHEGRSLVGHYRYDDEGVHAAEAQLVHDGVLQGYLTTRTGIAARHSSNGHARTSYHQRPISRMGVTLVEAQGGLDERGLKQALLDEIARQKAPFGMRVIAATGGETATDAYNFQAFLGEINLAAKVYPDGREEWVRGVDFVGTPLNAVRGILAAGRRLEVDNAYCGAESGYLPVSTISPALVISELEMQSKPDSPYTPYTYRMPWEKPKDARRRR
ncbi:MAG: hypothetical protein GY716_09015 [bacterium]|nr:hypothetical protein [bacterium]